MNDLLQLAVAAHGGTRRWSDFFKLEAQLSVGGTLLAGRVEREPALTVRLVADLYKQRVVWAPAGEQLLNTDAAWGPQQTAWFSGDTAWSDLVQPFLYTYPGFVCEEIAPWEEDGETWRRLKITLPEQLAQHGREQVSYFGPDGLLRRHDYQLDEQGALQCASYASDYLNVDGIGVPTRRRIYARDAAGRRVAQAPLFAIDIDHIAFV